MIKPKLSKLQQWILINCYRVTVLNDRTKLKPLKTIAPGNLSRFWRYDILLSWYDLESSYQNIFLSVHRMRESRNYYTAQAALIRSLNNLHDKGMISNPQGMYCIELEAEGMARARELLNVKGLDSGGKTYNI